MIPYAMQLGITPPHAVTVRGKRVLMKDDAEPEQKALMWKEGVKDRRDRIVRELQVTGEAPTADLAIWIGGAKEKLIRDLQFLVKEGRVKCRTVPINRKAHAFYWSAT